MKRRYILQKVLVLLVFSLSVSAQLEKNSPNQTKDFEGIIRAVVFEDEKGTRQYFLDTGDGRFALALKEENFLNVKVLVTGKLNAQNTIVPEKIELLTPAKAVSEVPVSGVRKVLVLLLNFQNDTSQPVTADQVKSKIFTDTKSPNKFYQQVSENRLRLGGDQTPDGDVAGYFTLPYTNESCNVAEWFPAADNLAAGIGINVNSYQSVIYLFSGNNPTCRSVFGELGVVGDQTTTNRVYFIDPFDAFYWTHFQYYIAHEIGHNLGLGHVRGFGFCPTNIPIENCFNPIEHAVDRSDVMGYFGYHLLSNYHRQQLGWLTGKVNTYDSPGIYYVNLPISPSHPSKTTTMAQIQLKDANGNFTGQSFYLEYRRNLPPFDIFESGEFPSPPLQLADKGVSIRLGQINTPMIFPKYYIIDTTPENGEFGDAALTPGRTYANSYYGVRITTISVNPFFGARVKIELTR